MTKWRHRLSNSESLREAIENEAIDDVLYELLSSFEEINRVYPDEYTEDELEDDRADIESMLDDYNNDEDIEDAVNYLLDEFYDLCDALRIWVELD